MNEFLIKIIPIILLFATGWITRLLRVFTTRDADLFLKLVLNVTLPAMIIATAQDMIMDKSLIYLPFIAIMIVVILSIIGKFTGRQLKMNRPDTGSFLVGIMIMNTGFCLPFIEAIYGRQGVLIANLFDIGNTFMIYTFVYYHAIRYGKNESGSLDWKKFLKLPPLWGLLIGFGLRFLNVKIPAMPMLFFELAGVATTPLIMLSLGIYFHPRVKRLPKALLAVVLRMGFGFLISYLAVTLLNITGLPRVIILVSGSAPIGFNTIIFANLEELDKEFASTMVSISIVIGLVLLPTLLYLFR